MSLSEGIILSCPMSDEEMNSNHGAEFMGASFTSIMERVPTADFEISLGNQLQQNQEAIDAFQFAIDIWSREIVSAVPIKIFVDFTSIEGSILGQAGPSYFVSNFPGAPSNSISYPAALANALAGRQLFPDQPTDLVISLNSNVNFYLGTDGNTPAGQFDLVSIALHEIGHGLGFVATPSAQGNTASLTRATGFQLPYATFVVNNNNLRASDIPDPSVELFNYLTSNNLFFDGENAVAALNGEKPQIEASPFFSAGSSISHLDERAFPAGDSNSLMTPQIGRSESNFDIGDVTRGIFKDMGWNLNNNILFPLSVGEAFGQFEVNQGENGEQIILVKNESNTALVVNASIRNNPQEIPIVLGNAVDIELQPGEEKEVLIMLETALLEPDTYNTEIIFSTNTSSAIIQRDISINVLNGTEVAIIETVQSIEHDIAILADNISEVFTISNTGNRILRYNIAVEDQEIPFLMLNTNEGSILENTSTDIEYGINSDLPEGTYTANINITSNAANSPSLIIPVTLNIIAAPKPTFEISLGDRIEIFIDANNPRTRIDFNVSNPGELSLQYALIPQTNNIFALGTVNARGSVSPNETKSGFFDVFLGPDAILDNYSDTITFISNDPSIPEITIPIIITISKERGRLSLRNQPSFSPTIELNTFEIRSLEIENTGLQPVIIENVASITPNSEVISWSTPNQNIVAVGETLTVVTRFSPQGNINTSQQGAIQVISNATSNSISGNNIFSFSTIIAEPKSLTISQNRISETINLNSIEADNPIRTQEITITNTSNTTFDYTLTLADTTNTIVTINNNSGTLNAGQRTTFIVTLDGREQVIGVFENEILFTINGNTTPETTITTLLEVINPIGFFGDKPDIEITVEESIALGSIELFNVSNYPIEIYDIATENTYISSEVTSILNNNLFSEENFILNPNESLTIAFILDLEEDNFIDDNFIITSNANTPILKLPLLVNNVTLNFNDVNTPSNGIESFMVAPNPVEVLAAFKVSLKTPKEVTISLKNILQQEINTNNRITINPNGNGSIQMSGLQSGIYFLSITDKNSGVTYRSKILKR